MFSAKCRECKIRKRDGHGKSRNGHGKVMEKYFVKCVGTLKNYVYRPIYTAVKSSSGRMPLTSPRCGGPSPLPPPPSPLLPCPPGSPPVANRWPGLTPDWPPPPPDVTGPLTNDKWNCSKWAVGGLERGLFEREGTGGGGSRCGCMGKLVGLPCYRGGDGVGWKGSQIDISHKNIEVLVTFTCFSISWRVKIARDRTL